MSDPNVIWTRELAHAGNIERIRVFAGGTRAQVVSSRAKHVIDTATGDLVDTKVPWEPSPEAIARAIAALSTPVDTHALRAVSSDGQLLFFVLGRNEQSSWDPDAGTLTTYDVTCALWDASARAWRWETSRSLDGLGVNTWLLEQASFEFTPDDRGIRGRGGGHESTQVHTVETGAPRPLRATDAAPATRIPNATATAALPGGDILVGTRDGRLLRVRRA